MPTQHLRSAFSVLCPTAWVLALCVVPSHADEPKGVQVVYQCTGYIVPSKHIIVSARVAGQVIELNAEEGLVVQKGDVLARLESTEYKAQLDAALAGVKLAHAKLGKVKRGGDEKDVAIADAELARATAVVEQAQWRLEATTIRAPISGTVLVKKSEVGTISNPRTAHLSPGICELADLRELEVIVDVPERDISKVSRGQRCLIVLEALPKTTYQGQVARVMPIAERAKGTISVRVKIAVPAEDTQLRPEMRALVKLLSPDA
jgi:HlyD family secretion protein